MVSLNEDVHESGNLTASESENVHEVEPFQDEHDESELAKGKKVLTSASSNRTADVVTTTNESHSTSGSVSLSYMSFEDSTSRQSVAVEEILVGPSSPNKHLTFADKMVGGIVSNDYVDGSVSSFDPPAVLLNGGSVGSKQSLVPGQTRLYRKGPRGSNKTPIPRPQFRKSLDDSTYVIQRAQQFIELCQKPFGFRRGRDYDEHALAWRDVQEELVSIRKDDFLSTFIVRYQDEEASTALHYVCAGCPPIYLVETLLEVSAQPVKRRNKDGNLPLHVAAQSGASYDVMKAVLEQYPDGANTKNGEGRLPVLLALMSNAQPKIVELLKRRTASSNWEEIEVYLKRWESFQMFLHHRSKHNRTPGFWEAMNNTLEALRTDDEYPRMAEWMIEHVDDDEDTPLHIACGLFPPVDLIRTMIEVSKTPLQMQNAWGGLPLHCVFLRGAGENITMLLCKEYPEAIRVQDDFGSFPLHYALQNGATIHVVKVLLNEFPEACGLKDNDGHLPLHVAAMTGSPESILTKLIDCYPKATRTRDNFGNLPVHYAIRGYSSRAIISILDKVGPMEEGTSRKARNFLEKCDVYGIVHPPQSIRRTTTVKLGESPLQRDLWAEVRDEMKSFTSDSFLAEEVATYRDEYGNTPLHIVCMSRPPIDVVKSLIKMSATPLHGMKNEHGWLPLHCAIRYYASFHVVKALLDASPDSCKVQNEHGKLPFQMAVDVNSSAEVKKILFVSDKTKSKEIEDVSQRAREFRRLCTVARHHTKQRRQDYDPKNHAWQVVRDEIFSLKEEDKIVKRVAEYRGEDTGLTPLHIVCGSPEVPTDIVELILGLSTEPLRMRSKRERLPLHIALDNGASDSVLKLLIKAHPEDTKKEDLFDGCLHSLKTAVLSGVSVEVIKLLTDVSPVPVSEQGMSFLESLEIQERHETKQSGASRIRATILGSKSQPSKPPVNELEQELMDPANSKIKVSENKMKVIIMSFLDEYRDCDFFSVDEEEMDVSSLEDNGELPVVGRLLSFPREALMGEKDLDHERYLLVDRFFSFLRKMPTTLKEDALLHPGLQDMLNKMISRWSFAWILIADLFVTIAIVATFTAAATQRSNSNSLATYATPAEFVVLVFCLTYLILRELVQVLSYSANRILSMWYNDFWNWLDVAFISLLFASIVNLSTDDGVRTDAEQRLVMVTGGLSWIMLLVELRSTTIEFSVFTSGLINIIIKLIPFLVTSIILVEAFAFMFFVDAQADNEKECPPTEVVGLESGGHEEVVSEQTNFCTLSDAQLKVFAMTVSMEQDDFTGGDNGKTVLAVVFAFFFIVILLNVVIAIVNENWEDVQKDGKAVFWRARYEYVNEVDALGEWTASAVQWMKDARVGNVREIWRVPGGWFGVWLTLRSWFRGIFGWIVYALWFIVGLISLGILWDDSMRAWLLCRTPTVDAREFSNEMLRDELEINREETAASIDDMKQEIDSLKKQLILLLQEQRAHQDALKETIIGTVKREVGDLNRRLCGSSKETDDASAASFLSTSPP